MVCPEDTVLSEISQIQRANTVGFHCCETSRAVRFIQKVGLWKPRAEGLKNGELVFNGDSFSLET